MVGVAVPEHDPLHPPSRSPVAFAVSLIPFVPASSCTTPSSRPESSLASMPGLWKFGLTVLVVCLVASMAIAIVKLATTPTEILGAGFHDWHGRRLPR
jgi:hypothetical protein